MTTGEKIRAARKKAGLTQKKLGELCGIAEPTIRRYELDKLNPKIETLLKIAEPLGVRYSNLYGDTVAIDDEGFNISFDGGGTTGEMREILNGLINSLDNFDGDEGDELSPNDMAKLFQEYLSQYDKRKFKIIVRSSQRLPQPPAAPSEGKDSTPPSDGSEGPPEDGEGE